MIRDLSSKVSGPVRSLFRTVVGFLFACHGAALLFGVLGGASGTHGGTVPLGAWPAWWAAVIELVGGAMVALGLFTPVAALICSGSMAYAYFMVHQSIGALPIENKGEPAALYAWAFLLIAITGSGPWTISRLFRRPRASGEVSYVAARASAGARTTADA